MPRLCCRSEDTARLPWPGAKLILVSCLRIPGARTSLSSMGEKEASSGILSLRTGTCDGNLLCPRWDKKHPGLWAWPDL